MALTQEHKLGMIYLNVLCEYAATPDLKGYSIAMATYGGELEKWATAVGMCTGMKLVGTTLKLNITITL